MSFLSKLLATFIFLSAPPLLAQPTPLIFVPDTTFATLSRRGTPKDILRGGGKRHACLTTADRLSATTTKADKNKKKMQL